MREAAAVAGSGGYTGSKEETLRLLSVHIQNVASAQAVSSSVDFYFFLQSC